MKSLDALTDVRRSFVAKLVAILTTFVLVMSSVSTPALAYALDVEETGDNAEVTVLADETSETDGLEIESTETDEAPATTEEETPQAVQDLLDAVAALPSVDSVTAENAEAVVDQVNAIIDMWEALDSDLADRDDVTAAMDTAYAVFAAVLEAAGVENGETLQTVRGSEIVISTDSPSSFINCPDIGIDGNIGNYGGKLTKMLGEEGFYLRCPTKTIYGNGTNGCSHVYGELSPIGYAGVNAQSSNEGIVRVDLGIGYWTSGDFQGAECLRYAFVPQKPGDTRLTLNYYVNYLLESGRWTCWAHWNPVTSIWSSDYTWHRYSDIVDLTVNAQYVLNYNTLGGSAVASTTKTVADTTATLNVTNTIPTKDGGEFLCWKDDEGNTYQPGSSIELDWKEGFGSTNNPVSKTLYAVWKDDAKYQVMREYYINDELVATVTTYTPDLAKGKVGDVISGAKLDEDNPSWRTYKVDTKDLEFNYEGSSPEDLVLAAAPVTNEIILKYKRTTASISDLFVSKTADEQNPIVGNEFQYTIKVKNSGNVAATVTVTDKLPSELDFTRVSETDGGVYDETSHTVTWENVTVPAYGSKDLYVWVKANTAGTIENTATVALDKETTSGSSTVNAQETVVLPTVTKKADTQNAKVGDKINYTVTITNNSDKTQTIKVNDTLPEGLELGDSIGIAGATGASGSVTGTGTVITKDNIDDFLAGITNRAKSFTDLEVTIEPGKTATLTYSATATKAGELTNTVSATVGGTETVTDSATVTVTEPEPAQEPAVSVTKTALTPNPVKGSLAKYKVTITNMTDQQQTVTFKDILPEGLALGNGTTQSIQHSGGSVVGSVSGSMNGIGATFTLAAKKGASITFEYTARVTAEVGTTVTNTAIASVGGDSFEATADVTVVEPEKEKVTLTFDANGGINPPAPVTVDKGTIYNVTLGQGNMTRDTEDGRYIFLGWSEDPDKTLAEEPQYVLDADKTIYAIWEHQYSVTYTDGVDDEVIFEDQTTWTAEGNHTPEFDGVTPTREGYTFIGWAPQVDELVSGNATYIAQWEPVSEPVNPGPVIPTPEPTPTPTPTPTPGPAAPVVTIAAAPVPAVAAAVPAPAAAPVAAPVAEATIGDDANPMAAPEEETIADDEIPMGVFDDPQCWVHIWMIIGMILTAIYGVAVVARRSKFTKDNTDFEKRVLGKNKSTDQVFVPVGSHQAL